MSWHLKYLKFVAEEVGFEPTCPVKDNSISSRARYDHFDTPPYISLKNSSVINYKVYCCVNQDTA